MKVKGVIDGSNKKTIVYKYRSCSSRNIEMISAHEIWSSSFKDLDDSVFEGLLKDKVVEQLSILEKIPRAPIGELKKNWLDLRKLVDSVGIYSLSLSSQGYADNVLMWSNYADSNKGFCLGFDLDMLLDSEDYTFMLEEVKVNYSEDVPDRRVRDRAASRDARPGVAHLRGPSRDDISRRCGRAKDLQRVRGGSQE